MLYTECVLVFTSTKMINMFQHFPFPPPPPPLFMSLRERVNKRRVKDIVKEFTLVCRGLHGTEYTAEYWTVPAGVQSDPKLQFRPDPHLKLNPNANNVKVTDWQTQRCSEACTARTWRGRSISLFSFPSTPLSQSSFLALWDVVSVACFEQQNFSYKALLYPLLPTSSTPAACGL